MKYLFILGRNPELSVAEVESYFEKEEIKFSIISKFSNGVLVEIPNVIQKGIINNFGGVVSIGEVLAEGSASQITKQLEKEMLYSGTSNKLNYVVFDFNGKNTDEISLYLKLRFKEEKLKATEKKLTGNIKLQDGESVSKVASNLIDEEFFVYENCFGKIVEKCDYKEIENRDMKKPVRRQELSISPRLAKILINLSGVKKGETLLDPFCGIGTVLQEALLQGIKVVGVDRDKNAIEGAKKNLEWFRFNKMKYLLVNNDSTKVRTQKVNAIATEPDLGEILKKSPSDQKAREIILGFESLMIRVLNNLKNNVEGKIVFTAPLIQVHKKRIACDFERIANETSLKISEGFPIAEFREGKIVSRSIVVMTK
jgi:tRNA G10  N-methylase Trm11